MAVERDNAGLSSAFNNILQSAKDAMNTRADEKTGQYYVKGQPAHKGDSDPVMGYGDKDVDFESDPSLGK